MKYEDWEANVPPCIRADSLWRMKACRLGLFLADLCWSDVTKLVKDRRTVEIADQLYRAVGKVSSNLAEGYSRGTGRARATFYEYALGSLREARDWYYKGRHVLSERVTEHRMELATAMIQLTLTMVSREGGTNRRVAAVKRMGRPVTFDV